MIGSAVELSCFSQKKAANFAWPLFYLVIQFLVLEKLSFGVLIPFNKYSITYLLLSLILLIPISRTP